MKYLLILFISAGILLSCKKKSPTQPTGADKLFTFKELKSDHDTIQQGNVTNIKASISGDGSYKWSSSAGDLFGSGSLVLFGASTCCTGNHEVTCTVTDKNNNSESKTINIYVK